MSISPEQNLRFNQIVEKKVKSACPTILSESDCSKRAPMWDSVQEAILKCWREEFPEIYTVPELPEKLTRRYQKFTEQCLSPSEIGLNERSCSVSQRAVTESDRTQELLSVISAIVGRLRIKLSSLPIPQGEIVLVEKFFLRDEKNYKSLDWFLLRSEGEIKKNCFRDF